MDHDNHHMGHENGGYMGNDGWNMNQNYHSSSQHQSPVYEQNGFSFMQQPLHEGIPTTQPFPSQRMPLLQPSPAHTSPPQLQPLIMPGQSTWPSMMITNPGYPPPAVTIPVSGPAILRRNGKKTSRSRSTSSPRRTLTDSDRRRMCQYHVDNPSVKQTQIGTMFGVERSTVSKVLVKKEKYLGPESGSTSPTRRKGTKLPDIDRTLAMWAKKMQEQGNALSDDDIRDKANTFAATLHPNNEIFQKINSPDWLQKFKGRNGIGQSRLNRRASETNLPSNSLNIFLEPDSAGNSASQTPTGLSPISPRGLTSQSPLSGVKNEDLESERMDGYFGHENGGYRHSNSQSHASLSGAFSTDNVPTPFSTGPTSPQTPFAFSPDSSGSWLPSQQARLLPPGNFQRPRSQTFPMIDPSFISAQGSEPPTAKYNLPLTAPPSALDSPMEGMLPPYEMDSVINSPPLHSIHRSSSNGSMGMSSSGETVSGLQSPPRSSGPSSPTQDDARRALDTLLTFFSQSTSLRGFGDRDEYRTVLKLTEKLRLHSNDSLPGGLHRIVEQDCEATPKMEHT
ncbi:hypothetical protein VTL71DRAFT_8466 [Oculimacula yallundae]|uniref:HTH CENPB-type domain-containing protein n=1 Tax=Oculimacula yallundae TaxID=86028 RepID=A0ABR4CYP6_9HELO